jgi:hypothetical protein
VSLSLSLSLSQQEEEEQEKGREGRGRREGTKEDGDPKKKKKRRGDHERKTKSRSEQLFSGLFLLLFLLKLFSPRLFFPCPSPSPLPFLSSPPLLSSPLLSSPFLSFFSSQTSPPLLLLRSSSLDKPKTLRLSLEGSFASLPWNEPKLVYASRGSLLLSFPSSSPLRLLLLLFFSVAPP